MPSALATVETSIATRQHHYRQPAWSTGVGFFSRTSGGASIVRDEALPREYGSRLRLSSSESPLRLGDKARAAMPLGRFNPRSQDAPSASSVRSPPSADPRCASPSRGPLVRRTVVRSCVPSGYRQAKLPRGMTSAISPSAPFSADARSAIIAKIARLRFSLVGGILEVAMSLAARLETFRARAIAELVDAQSQVAVDTTLSRPRLQQHESRMAAFGHCWSFSVCLGGINGYTPMMCLPRR
jgi:hypothetical protein